MRLRLAALALLAGTPLAWAQAQTPLTLEQAMANPDWIGPPVEQAWWRWDGADIYYTLKRAGSPVRDTWRQPTAGGAAQKVEGAALADLDGNAPVYDAAHQRAVFVRNDDLFLRDLRSGALTQITRSDDSEADPEFAAD